MSSLIPVPTLKSSSSQKSGLSEYFANIGRAIGTIFDGLSVTSSWMFRRPMTIQYPDRTAQTVQEMLPTAYRGLLEVDMVRCSGCLLCAKACPIDCINITVAKNQTTGIREIGHFDIDIGRCMYCGLCAEACKFDSLSHTAEFESASASPEDMVLHFVVDPVPVSKHKLGEGPARQPLGSILHRVARAIPERGRWMGAFEPANTQSQDAPAPAPTPTPTATTAGGAEDEGNPAESK
jgi:formate hydrogenlyase subunit 6/NADH:ubiquinone oxidoreductase subunit I